MLRIMGQRFRFAVISDPHITLPETLWDSPNRFHLVEVSVSALESILAHLETLALDFLLLPGDLTQHGEWVNHYWLIERLKQLPFPVYVVPGNHDIIARDSSDCAIGLSDFPKLYADFGYSDMNKPYYSREILPGVRLIGLNSNSYNEVGQLFEMGYIDPEQLAWLDQELATIGDDLVLVMLHHNLLEHLYGQAQNPLGQRYMVSNRDRLISRLEATGVQLIFTGHLHVQNVACQNGLREIVTGSLVSYPHPYRVLEIEQTPRGIHVDLQSYRVTAVPDWPDLQVASFDWMYERAAPFMKKFLTSPPINLSLPEATAIAPSLRHFWAAIADGDPQLDLSHLPPKPRQILEKFNAIDADGNPEFIDNSARFVL